MSPDGLRLCLNDGRGGRPLRSLACPSASCTWPNIEYSRCVCSRVSAASWCTGVRRLSRTLEISLARGRNCHPSTVFHKKMYQSNRSNTLPLHHDAARNMHLEISSYTQVKNRVCAKCMAEQTGVHGVICHAEARKYVPEHALELILPALMPPRACAVPPRHTCTPLAQDGRQVHTCRAESALDGYSGFAHAVIMFVQTQSCGQCAPRYRLRVRVECANISIARIFFRSGHFYQVRQLLATTGRNEKAREAGQTTLPIPRRVTASAAELGPDRHG